MSRHLLRSCPLLVLLALLLSADAQRIWDPTEVLGTERLATIKIFRHQFIENPAPGLQRIYRGYAADVAARAGATNEEMHDFAHGLFESRLRELTDAEGGDLVWITF